MKRLLLIALTLTGVVALTLLALEERGYVLIRYRDWQLESSLALLLFCMAALFFLLTLFLRLLAALRGAPRLLRRRAVKRAHAALARGAIALAEGRWKSAEKQLTASASASDVPLLHHLGAALAAQQRGAVDPWEGPLRLARRTAPDAEIAIRILQAEQQLTTRQSERAAANLRELQQKAPKNGRVLRLSARLYLEKRLWTPLLELIQPLRKREAMTREEIAALEVRAFAGLLQQAARDRAPEALHAAWGRLPKALRDNESLLRAYVVGLIAHGREADAEPLLRRALERVWRPDLAALYGRLDAADPAALNERIRRVEAWKRRRADDPALLVTLGRLYSRARRWEEACAALRASLRPRPRADALFALARALEKQGDAQAALATYHHGARLLSAAITAPDDERPTAGRTAEQIEAEQSGE